MSSLPEAKTRIGPYEIVRRLGIGGMAETYVAVRRGPGSFEQRVCLKVIRRDHADDPDRVRQFLAEAALVARLRHGSITQVLDFGQDGAGYYLALELIDGLDLSQLMEARGPLPPELLLYVAVELATALDFAHRAGGDATLGPVVHRDVSPSNTLFSTEGEVKLSDFGIARPLDGPQHTRTGIVKGKVPYLAPEYARSGRFDARCDLFSLGALLYEAATGVPPHDGATDLETLERAALGERKPLAELAPELPEALVSIVDHLLEPDPARRTQSAALLLEALSSLPVSPRARRELGRRVVDARPQPPESQSPPQPMIGDAPSDAAARLGSALTEPHPSRPDAPFPRTQLLAPRLDLAPEDPPPRRKLSRGPKIALGLAALSVLTLVVVAATRGPRTPPVEPELSASAPAARPASTAATAGAEGTAAPAAEPPAPTAPTAVPGTTRPAAEASAHSPSQPSRSARPAVLEIVAVPYGEIAIDGNVAGWSPLTVRLAPGEHVITAKNSGGKSQRRITLTAGERQQIVMR